MAFDIRCPECKAKLRLDEAPDPDTPIECPRCGSQFEAPDDAAPAAGGKAKAKKPAGGPPQRKKAKKKKTNPAVLLIAIFAGLVCIVAIGFGLHWFVGRAGKVEEMLTCVPGECNWARGVNTGQLVNYPGYNDQVSKFKTASVQAASDDVARAAGQDPADFLNYLVIAKSRQTSGTGTMYVFRSKKKFNKDALGTGLPGAATYQVNGETCYRTNGSGLLAGAVVYCPSDRIVVIVPQGQMQNQLISGAVNGKSNKKDSFAGQLDTSGWMAAKGSIWLIIRQTGALSNYIPDSLGEAAKDFPKLEEKAKKAKTFAQWTTPGGSGVRFGAAIECESSKDADELPSYFRKGPLGQGDESEPPNGFKRSFNFTGDKRGFGEMMQYMGFYSTRSCAYITTKLEGDNAKKLMNIFNNPAMGSDEGGFGGGFGGGQPLPGGGQPLPGGGGPPRGGP